MEKCPECGWDMLPYKFRQICRGGPRIIDAVVCGNELCLKTKVLVYPPGMTELGMRLLDAIVRRDFLNKKMRI